MSSKKIRNLNEITTPQLQDFLYLVKSTTGDGKITLESIKNLLIEQGVQNLNYISQIDGLEIVNNSITPNTHIDIKPGYCRDNTNYQDLYNNSLITKSLSSAFQVGTNNGMRHPQSPLVSNTAYHIFILDTNNEFLAVDTASCYSQDGKIFINTSLRSLSQATLGIAVNKYRRIGTIITNSSTNIYQFSQSGNLVLYKTPINQYYGTITNTPTTVVVSCPPDVSCLVYVKGSGYKSNATGVYYLNVYSPETSIDSATPQDCVCSSGSSSAANGAAYSTTVFTKTQRVKAIVSQPNMDVVAVTLIGYLELNRI